VAHTPALIAHLAIHLLGRHWALRRFPSVTSNPLQIFLIPHIPPHHYPLKLLSMFWYHKSTIPQPTRTNYRLSSKTPVSSDMGSARQEYLRESLPCMSHLPTVALLPAISMVWGSWKSSCILTRKLLLPECILIYFAPS